jgi:trans-2,3-dihydro-3-hydroxyanthranilate isomerase
MTSYEFVTLDVFTTEQFGGNPLAVFPDARGMTGEQMQRIAREFNLSETTFVLPPRDPAHSAWVRIFNPTYEMPFAGHPNVGTGHVLASLGRDRIGELLFEEGAGLVRVAVQRDAGGAPSRVTIDAPQPLTAAPAMSVAQLAACLSLRADDLVTTAHPPMAASVGNPFVIVEVRAEALARAQPDLAAIREAESARPLQDKPLCIYLYARDGERLRARMFAPLAGVVEDPATGSAATPLGALLLSLGSEARREFEILQGVEMGRPSTLYVTAWREASVGGQCVPVMRGSLALHD